MEGQWFWGDVEPRKQPLTVSNSKSQQMLKWTNHHSRGWKARSGRDLSISGKKIAPETCSLRHHCLRQESVFTYAPGAHACDAWTLPVGRQVRDVTQLSRK
ncbi:hypothetical protein NPIL_527581 [Nephila pilipes]|uniref:Uncharacterized protein n=1 Tax=Nephila pilipes TaxID=299642 RepID=A0A8X6TNM0_NEPPI|nr:hypothetical protein NPIL_527581 [Nephila pilipes]